MYWPVGAVSNSFRDQNIAASLKRAIVRVVDYAMRGIPRSKHRGLIEAGPVSMESLLKGTFRDQNIAASLKLALVGTKGLHVSGIPRSKHRGLIEALFREPFAKPLTKHSAIKTSRPH